jgi:lipoic acid synthetase
MIMTLGQYLQPTLKHMPVAEYIPPEIFENYRQIGLSRGFSFVESAPLVRSSYHAEKHLQI